MKEKIDRLRKMATEAIQQYSDETFSGGEPVYPQWAQDMLDVLNMVDPGERQDAQEMQEYELHTQGARHSFEPKYDGRDPDRNRGIEALRHGAQPMYFNERGEQVSANQNWVVQSGGGA